LDGLKTRLRTKLQEEIEKDTAIHTKESVHLGLLEAFHFQVMAWAKGYGGISLKDSFGVHTLGNGESSVEYGAFHLGTIVDSDVPRIKAMIKRWERKLTKRQEYNDAKANNCFGTNGIANY